MGPRRALLLFRLVLYGLALALGIWLLAGRGEAAEVAEYAGTTAQHRPIVVTVDGDRVTVEARLETSCEGLRPGLRYYSSWGTGTRDGDRVLVRGRSARDYGDGWTSERSSAVRGRIEDGELRGRISLAEVWDGGRAGRTRCAGDVAFSARR